MTKKLEFKVGKLVAEFFKNKVPYIELYNEAGLQHELAIFLREKGCSVKLEYPINDLNPQISNKLIKKEIDILVDSTNELVLIELKFPRKGAGMPMEIYRAIEDVRFGEQAIKKTKVNSFICVFLTDHKSITAKKNINHLYGFFNRDEPSLNSVSFSENELPKFMENKDSILLENEYPIKWEEFKNASSEFKYYIVSNIPRSFH